VLEASNFVEASYHALQLSAERRHAGGMAFTASKLVAELEQIERDAEEGYVPPFGLIWAYAGLDELDRAFAALERSFQLGSDRMIWLNVDLLLAPLRSDPRFADLARRIGLPSADRS
jgi:hypothetical protein